MNRINITKVVSKSFVTDFIAKVQNLVGHNLTGYEDMIGTGIRQIEEELAGIELKWYRYEITQLTNGAMAIMLYGERK